jgi:hypothetical protein
MLVRRSHSHENTDRPSTSTNRNSIRVTASTPVADTTSPTHTLPKATETDDVPATPRAAPAKKPRQTKTPA